MPADVSRKDWKYWAKAPVYAGLPGIGRFDGTELSRKYSAENVLTTVIWGCGLLSIELSFWGRRIVPEVSGMIGMIGDGGDDAELIAADDVAMWRATVVELLEAVVEGQRRTEKGLAALAAILVARKPGGPVRNPASVGPVSSIRRTMDGGVADRAMALLQMHKDSQWQRLQLPILRTLERLGGKATRREIVGAVRAQPVFVGRALAALEAEGFVEMNVLRRSTGRSVELWSLTDIAAVMQAIGAESDAADGDAGGDTGGDTAEE